MEQQMCWSQIRIFSPSRRNLSRLDPLARSVFSVIGYLNSNRMTRHTRVSPCWSSHKVSPFEMRWCTYSLHPWWMCRCVFCRLPGNNECAMFAWNLIMFWGRGQKVIGKRKEKRVSSLPSRHLVFSSSKVENRQQTWTPSLILSPCCLTSDRVWCVSHIWKLSRAQSPDLAPCWIFCRRFVKHVILQNEIIRGDTE